MTRIFLLRHGETVWNKELKYQGQTDIELTAEGIMQAERAGARLAEEDLAAVYASDLIRARVTAEKIAAYHSLPVIPEPGLREISFGEWEGMTYGGINEKWPAEMEKFFNHSAEAVIPGGETFPAVQQRAMAALQKIAARHPDAEIAIVSHGGTIRTILCALLHMDLNCLWTIRQFNTAVNIIDFSADKVLVELINDTHHLKFDYRLLGDKQNHL